MVPLQLLVTDILNVTKSFLVTTKSRQLVTQLKRYFLYTSPDVVTLSKEMYKTYVTLHNFLPFGKVTK
jgi:hypothetical protein